MMTTLIPPQRSPMTAASGFVASLFIGSISALLALDAGVSTTARGAIAIIGGALAFGIGLAAVKLARSRGGLFLDPSTGRLGVGLTGSKDTYWVPLEAIEGVGTRYQDVRFGDEKARLWSAEVVCRDRPSIVLAEDPERAPIDQIVDQLGQAQGLARLEQALPAGTHVPADNSPVTSVKLGVHRGGALVDVLNMLGMSLAGIGIALFMQLQTEPMVAVFIAPVLGLVGFTLAGIAWTKRWAAERLECTSQSLTRTWHLGPLTWGTQRIELRGPLRWRLRVQSLKGAYLEVLGHESTIATGAGATTLSRIDVEGLNRIARRLSNESPAGTPPEP